jgi:hypothetical protein
MTHLKKEDTIPLSHHLQLRQRPGQQRQEVA